MVLISGKQWHEIDCYSLIVSLLFPAQLPLTSPALCLPHCSPSEPSNLEDEIQIPQSTAGLAGEGPGSLSLPLCPVHTLSSLPIQTLPFLISSTCFSLTLKSSFLPGISSFSIKLPCKHFLLQRHTGPFQRPDMVICLPFSRPRTS